jgi:hypothetical protein
MSGPPYVDIASLDEDKRIDLIGHRAMDHKEVVAFVTDADPGKANRYIRKLQAKFPTIRILDRFPGPVPNTVTVKVGPPAE